MALTIKKSAPTVAASHMAFFDISGADQLKYGGSNDVLFF